ncbi:MAG: dockerin type I repeat-containing protein [Planctomycetes bacterium]|nr:dockerin type I repeat-containing protein [Planctomycetota bacterium]
MRHGLWIVSLVLVGSILPSLRLGASLAPLDAQIIDYSQLWIVTDVGEVRAYPLEPFEPTTFTVFTPPQFPGHPDAVVRGLAWTIDLELFYVLAELDPVPSTPPGNAHLCTWDPESGAVSIIGDTYDDLICLALDGTGAPFGVSYSDATLRGIDAATGFSYPYCDLITPDVKRHLAFDPTTAWFVYAEKFDPNWVGTIDDPWTGLCGLDYQLIDPASPSPFVEAIAFSPVHDNLLWHTGLELDVVDPSTGQRTFLADFPLFDFVMTTGPAIQLASPALFRRGDTNDDGALNIADASTLLAYVGGSGSFPINCLDACDANDDGLINIADPVQILSYLFLTGSYFMAEPSPDCGLDPTPDSLICAQSICP